MNISFYLLKGVVYIPTSYTTPDGFYYNGTPLDFGPVEQHQRLYQAIQIAIQRGNPLISRDEVRSLIQGKSQPMLKASGMRSWSAFDHQLKGVWSLAANNGIYKIRVKRPMQTHGWSEDKDQAVTFPAGTPADDVIDRLIAMMQEQERQ